LPELDPTHEHLSARERQIAEAYAGGQSYRQIAERLFIAPTTVRTHLSTIYRKLGVSTKIELLRALERFDAAPEAGRLDVPFKSVGRQHLKNIAQPIEVWKWPSGEVKPIADPALEPTCEPCLAVLHVPEPDRPRESRIRCRWFHGGPYHSRVSH